MEELVKFGVEDIQLINDDNYSIEEFAIAKVGFLSSRPNSHKLKISNEVLMECASTVLGKFLVAEINQYTKDATTHTNGEIIYGYFPREQQVEFVEESDGTYRAYADAVISKIYAPELCAIFENGDNRDVSVEMKIETLNDLPLDDEVLAFNIVGVTVLGRGVKPSCPGSEMSFVRFSEKRAQEYFTKQHSTETILTEFVKERRKNMAKENYVNHPIDTSKEAVYEGAWDGDKAKQDLIKEEKYKSLAPKVCLRLEEGWEDREVTKLGYPVMCLHNGTWVYSKKGLASALGYAKQHDDNEIVNKVEKLYKKLGLDSERKEESAELSEIEFSAVNIGDMWGKLYDAIKAKYPRGEYDSAYWIDSIWEEDNKKYAIIHKYDEDELWRLDFNYTEEGLTLAEDIIKVDVEIVETDTVRKFAEPECVDKYKHFEQEEVCPECGMKMSECKCEQHENEKEDEDEDEDELKPETLMERIQALEKDIEARDNIIMEKDIELEDLRKFKQQRLEQDKAITVASVMNSVEDFMDKEEFEQFQKEGLSCEFSEIDAWTNKVKASIVDKALKKTKSNTEFSRISAPIKAEQQNSQNVWDRIKNKH